MNRKNIDKLVSEALAIEQEEAYKANAIGYMARVLVQATLPHSNPHDYSYERSNGILTLSITAPKSIGVPYGTYPRLILHWISTEVVQKQGELKDNKILNLGNSLSAFMNQLGLIPSGGRWGTIPALRRQMEKLFSSTISTRYSVKTAASTLNAVGNLLITEKSCLFWDAKQPNQICLWNSWIQLSETFFQEIINNPVPIDIRAIKALKNSAMALDLYCWLTYRNSYLNNKTEIPWGLLQLQFGANYEPTRQGQYNFKQKLKEQLKKVCLIYSDIKIDEGKKGLILIPSPPHVQKN